MTIFKKLRELPPHIPSAEPFTEHTERKRVFHAIFEKAGIRSIRLKLVDMLPVRKRTRDLNVAKVMATVEILMLCDPQFPKRPRADAKHNACAALDSTGGLDNLDVLPRRRELRESTR